MGFGYGHHALALRGRADALQLVGLNPVDLPRYMIETYDNLDTLQAFVSIQT
jgi:hypothetical protein